MDDVVVIDKLSSVIDAPTADEESIAILLALLVLIQHLHVSTQILLRVILHARSSLVYFRTHYSIRILVFSPLLRSFCVDAWLIHCLLVGPLLQRTTRPFNFAIKTV